MYTETDDGKPITKMVDAAIPFSVINDIHSLITMEGITFEKAVGIIRRKLVPPEYTPHTFRADTPESFLDQLRSVVATYRFRHTITSLKASGVDFSMYIHVPEIDDVTG